LLRVGGSSYNLFGNWFALCSTQDPYGLYMLCYD
jgi:hypothetical protein